MPPDRQTRRTPGIGSRGSVQNAVATQRADSTAPAADDLRHDDVRLCEAAVNLFMGVLADHRPRISDDELEQIRVRLLGRWCA